MCLFCSVGSVVLFSAQLKPKQEAEKHPFFRFRLLHFSRISPQHFSIRFPHNRLNNTVASASMLSRPVRDSIPRYRYMVRMLKYRHLRPIVMDWELARSWCFVWIEAHICSICTAASYNVLVDDKKTSTDEHLHNVVWHCLDLDSVSLVFQPASPGKCQLVGDIHSNRSIKNSASFQKSCASKTSLISANVSSCNGPLVEANRLKSTVG